MHLITWVPFLTSAEMEDSFPGIQEHHVTIPRFYNRGSPHSELMYVIQGRMWDVCACGMRQNSLWYLIPIPFAIYMLVVKGECTNITYQIYLSTCNP